MLEEHYLEEGLKRIKEEIEELVDKTFGLDDPIKALMDISVFISKIEETGELNDLITSAEDLGFISFKERVLDPIQKFCKKYGRNSTIWNKRTYSDPKKAKELFNKSRNELNNLLSTLKVNSYIY